MLLRADVLRPRMGHPARRASTVVRMTFFKAAAASQNAMAFRLLRLVSSNVTAHGAVGLLRRRRGDAPQPELQDAYAFCAVFGFPRLSRLRTRMKSSASRAAASTPPALYTAAM